MSLTDEQREIIKSSAPILRENAKEITSIFYRELFKAHPELLNMFNQTNQKIGSQPLALANTIYLAAENIDKLDTLMPWIRVVSHKHRALMVQPDHYPILSHFLLDAIAKVLGDKATPEFLNAWSTAYKIIASVFIDVEKQLYAELGNDETRDFLPFTIVKKELLANETVTALTMQRCDYEEMKPYVAGQYLTIQVDKDGYLHNRHYSLTCPFDGSTYSVAIKQEKEKEPFGTVSNEITNNYQEGDTILASLPAGDFVLVKEAKRHLFMAGGIGITAIAAMIRELNNQHKIDSATLIYYISKKGYACFTEELEALLPKDNCIILYGENRITKDLLESKLTPDTYVYMCGSPSFLDTARKYLTELNHPESQVSFESFVPRLSLINNAVKDQSQTQVI